MEQLHFVTVRGALRTSMRTEPQWQFAVSMECSIWVRISNSRQGKDMLGSDILEVCIGIIFVFVLVSTLCTAVREAIEAWLKTRASYLEFGIRQLLNDPRGNGIAKQLFEHPLVSGLYAGRYEPDDSGKEPKRRLFARNKNLPSYIPARNFALALMDLAARGPVTQQAPRAARISVASIRENIAALGNPYVQRAVLTAADAAQDDLGRTQQNLEAWYDSAMDRVSGWYKRSTHNILFVTSLVIVIALNVNTITISDYLFRHDAVRSSIIAGIEKSPGDATEALQRLDDLHLPLGWTGDGLEASWGAPRTRGERAAFADKSVAEIPWQAWDDILAPLLGWLITAFAATLGAPFWFDLLNKVMVIRSTVKPHEKSPEEGSEDRQPKTTPRAAARTVASPAAAPAVPEDFCGVGAGVIATPDERLPPARGGVA
jgi:hypothetical protein